MKKRVTLKELRIEFENLHAKIQSTYAWCLDDESDSIEEVWNDYQRGLFSIKDLTDNIGYFKDLLTDAECEINENQNERATFKLVYDRY